MTQAQSCVRVTYWNGWPFFYMRLDSNTTPLSFLAQNFWMDNLKAPSTRAIFMWQVLFICQYKPRLHEQFLFENKRLETWIYGWNKKNCQFNYVLSRLRGQFSVCDNFYLPHKNYHTSFSANIIVLQKLVNFVHLHEQIKIAT